MEVERTVAALSADVGASQMKALEAVSAIEASLTDQLKELKNTTTAELATAGGDQLQFHGSTAAEQSDGSGGSKKYCKYDDIRTQLAESRARSYAQGRQGCCGKASSYLDSTMGDKPRPIKAYGGPKG